MSWHSRALLQLLLLSCSFLAASALYRDEAGLHDWTRQHVGRISTLALVSGDSGGADFLVGSVHAGSAARLAGSTGDIEWRHVHDVDDVSLTVANPEGLLMVAGASVLLFSAAGELRWSTALSKLGAGAGGSSDVHADQESHRQPLVAARFVGALKSDVLICSGAACALLSGTDGSILWKASFVQGEDGTRAKRILHAAIDIQISASIGNQAVIAGAAAGEGVVALLCSFAKGSTCSAVFHEPASEIAEPGRLAVTSRKVAILSNDKLTVLSPEDGTVGESDVPQATMVLAGDEWFACLNKRGLAHFVGSQSANAKLNAGEPLADKVQCTFTAAANALSRACTHIQVDDTVAVTIDVIEFSTAHTSQVASVFTDIPDVVDQIFHFGEFSVLRFASSAVLRIEHGPPSLILWRRDEGLSAISDVVFSDLPPTRSSDLAPHLIKDKFGYNHVVVAITDFGSIFGLHSESSEILWARHFSDCKPAFQASGRNSIFLVRGAAHKHPEVAALLLCPSSSRAADDRKFHDRLLTLSPLTGEILQDEVLKMNVQIARTLPRPDLATGTHPLVLFGTSADSGATVASLFPRRAEVLIAFQASSPVFVHDLQDSTLIGALCTKVLDNSTFALEVEPQWRTPLQGQIVAVAGNSRATRRAHAAGRALRGGGVWARYLNANLVAVASVVPGPESHDLPSVHVRLIDAVSGLTIHHAIQTNAAGPVHLTMSENLVVFSFWNILDARTDVASLEAFEGARLSIQNDLEWQRAKRAHARSKDKAPLHPPLDWKTKEVSSLDADMHGAVRVFDHTWVAPSHVSALALTETANGITQAQVLFGLSDGHVLALETMFVDPRRPPASLWTPELRAEENLIPDSPTLFPMARKMLNYDRVIPRLKLIRVQPTAMESTSIVFAAGTDIFMTRIAPSGTFDELGWHAGSLNRPILVLTMVGLAVASVVASGISQKRDLRQRWL